MTVDENNNALITYFKDRPFFTKEDICVFYKHAGISITDEALRIRIHRWKKKGIIQSLARGKYTIKKKPSFIPEPDKFIKKINKLYLSKYEDVDYCVWSTKSLHDLMLHIPNKYFYVFETEKDMCETVFYLFKDNSINAYYLPNQDQIDKYILPEEKSIIVRPLVSRAPFQTIEKIRMPNIEKILVDLYCDTGIYYIYGGSELKRIYENILKHYTINLSTLSHYAERRKRNLEIKEFILSNFENLVKGLL